MAGREEEVKVVLLRGWGGTGKTTVLNNLADAFYDSGFVDSRFKKVSAYNPKQTSPTNDRMFFLERDGLLVCITTAGDNEDAISEDFAALLDFIGKYGLDITAQNIIWICAVRYYTTANRKMFDILNAIETTYPSLIRHTEHWTTPVNKYELIALQNKKDLVALINLINSFCKLKIKVPNDPEPIVLNDPSVLPGLTSLYFGALRKRTDPYYSAQTEKLPLEDTVRYEFFRRLGNEYPVRFFEMEKSFGTVCNPDYLNSRMETRRLDSYFEMTDSTPWGFEFKYNRHGGSAKLFGNDFCDLFRLSLLQDSIKKYDVLLFNETCFRNMGESVPRFMKEILNLEEGKEVYVKMREIIWLFNELKTYGSFLEGAFSPFKEDLNKAKEKYDTLTKPGEFADYPYAPQWDFTVVCHARRDEPENHLRIYEVIPFAFKAPDDVKYTITSGGTVTDYYSNDSLITEQIEGQKTYMLKIGLTGCNVKSYRYWNPLANEFVDFNANQEGVTYHTLNLGTDKPSIPALKYVFEFKPKGGSDKYIEYKTLTFAYEI